MHKFFDFIAQLIYSQLVLLGSIFGCEQGPLKCGSYLLMLKFSFLTHHGELVLTAFFDLRQFHGCLVPRQASLLKLLLKLRYLTCVVLFLQVELLLKLIGLDLQFDTTFSFKIVGFEKLHLQRVTLLPQRVALLSQLGLHLLAL